MPPPHGTSAEEKLGAPPGRLPAPAPPHLRRAAPCSAPGRPQRSTGAPPGFSPRAPLGAARPGPARPGPASAAPPARPGPAWPGPRPARVGGATLGRVWGRPRPRGADTRRHPASRVSGGQHAGAARRDSGSLLPRASVWGLGRLRIRRRRRQVTLYPYPGPGASGSWSLFEHKGPGAEAAALPPSLVSSMPLPPDTLSSFGVQRGRRRVSCPRFGALRPSTSRGPRLGGCLPHPQPVGGGTLGFVEVAPPGGPFGEHTRSPPTLGDLTLESLGLSPARLSAPQPSLRVIS